MKKATRLNKILTALFVPACAAIVLTGCGGSGPEPYAQLGSAKASMSAYGGPGASSSALNSSGKFEGFNPAIWNEHMWYECNCGINPNTPPKAPPQDGLLLG